MDYKCDICSAEFYHKQYLTRHQSRVHGIKRRSATGEFSCLYCEKKFSSKNTLSEHRVKIHNVKKLTILCQEENCDEKFHLLSELRHHLMSQHDIPSINSCQNMEFEKYEDFCEWLAEEERNTDSKYVLSSSKNGNNCRYITFSCNRSGCYKPLIDDRERRLKAQGTSKLGFHCTANIQVKEMQSKVLISYYKGHYKHMKDLAHLPIPKSEKEAIAENNNTEATQNFKRHREGKNLSAQIVECAENMWNIISGNNTYCIVKNHLCNNECVKSCRICSPCINAYSCTCHDYEITNHMCKHIHFLSLSLDGRKIFTGPISSTLDNTLPISEPSINNRIDRHEFNKIKITSLSAKLNSLPNMEESVALQIGHHLNAIQHLMQITGDKILRTQNISNSEPSNKNILKQKRFRSVKKPCKSKKIKLSNPSSEEAKDKKSALLKQIFCSNNSSSDHTY